MVEQVFADALRCAGECVEVLAPDYRIVYVNRAFEIAYRCRAADVLGRTPRQLELAVSEVGRAIFTEIEAKVARGEMWRGELLGRRQDGTTFPMLMSAAAVLGEDDEIRGLICIKRDLTSVHEAIQAVRLRDDQFRHLVDLSPSAVVIHENGRIIYGNEACFHMLGDAKRVAVGRPVLDYVHPLDSERIRQRLEYLDREGGQLPPTEMRLVRLDGEVVYVRVYSGSPIEFEGRPARFFMALDITQQQRGLSRQLLADRLEAVGQVAMGVAHEVNNPLAFVGGNLELLELELARPEPDLGLMRDLVREARQGTNRIESIVRNLRAYTDDKARSDTIIDVRKVLSGAVELASKSIQERGRLIVEPVPAVSVRGSAARLGQVLVNLLLNAAHALPQEGGGQVLVSCVRQDGQVVVRVWDSGHGMDEETRIQAFQPFFTTKGADGRTGMGLAICQEIITSMGGEIQLQSRLNSGTEVSFSLPEVLAASISPPSDVRHDVGQLRVLVIDDQPLVTRSVARMVQRLGHSSQACLGGAEALRLLSHDPSWDVIICDLMMPDVDGPALYELFGQQHPQVQQRFLFMTGGAYTAKARNFLHGAGVLWIEKPFASAELQNKLAEVVASSR
ncbi:MAG: PAS domain S-box-containing protein [Kiritimatiellia bacterium]|jgi:PAS domain S-box-containing protein